MALLEPVLAGYLREGKRYVTLAVGCTGGKHRSVAVAEELSPAAQRRRRRDHPRAPRPGAGVTPPRRSSRSAAGTAWRRRLAALRLVTDRITAVVTVADDGGSSGRLREELGVLPPGDLRMALAALCDDSEWGHRGATCCSTGSPARDRCGGHAVGNLLIVALWELLGDTVAGLDWSAGCSAPGAGCCRWRPSRWRSRPASLGADPARPDDVSTVRGPGRGGDHAGAGRSASGCTRRTRRPARRPIRAVHDADWVVLGPGSWFTRVMPHLLVPSRP